MEGKRTVISQSKRRRSIPFGSSNYFYTEQVVYRDKHGSVTKHEKVKDQFARRKELQSN